MERWVVMVTDGTVIVFPPEVYESRQIANSEAERWGEALSNQGGGLTELGDGPPWQVDDFTIRVIELSVSLVELDYAWVGTYWTADGYPDPEAILLPDHAAALAWVLEPPTGFGPAIETTESELFVGSTYLDRGEQVYAVAHRAKQVRTTLSGPLAPPPPGEVSYEIEVAVSRLQRIEASLSGLPGLSREAMENLVDENWAAIADHVTEDHVVTWELERYAGG